MSGTRVGTLVLALCLGGARGPFSFASAPAQGGCMLLRGAERQGLGACRSDAHPETMDNVCAHSMPRRIALASACRGANNDTSAALGKRSSLPRGRRVNRAHNGTRSDDGNVASEGRRRRRSRSVQEREAEDIHLRRMFQVAAFHSSAWLRSP
ncbi:MAG: hypothetical protein ACPIOQ_72065 [Promethearchaeia archaeon]